MPYCTAKKHDKDKGAGMKKELSKKEIENALSRFALDGEVRSYAPYGSGHINDTYLVEANRKYILQRMNTNIFKNPRELMENVSLVCDFMEKEIRKNGGDPEREGLRLIPLKSVEEIGGKEAHYYYEDAEQNFFRVYLFIENAVSYNLVEKPAHFYESAYAFGHFQNLLAHFPAEKLHETIPDFHNSEKRFQRFLEVLQKDALHRRTDCGEEVQFFLSHEKDLSYAMELLRENKLPLRVSHNDTKLNNVLFDKNTEKALCIIDLDTVMPGLSIFDFGDAIRFGANTAEEDEQDLSKVSLSLPLFTTYVDGFLLGAGGKLSETEIASLPEGAKIMTLECGMRFLTDYLEGDVYFHTARPGHNLDRARTQMALVKDMERKWKEMKNVVEKHC